MQTRLVENWLTSVKELSYTVPFAQLLTQKGFKVLHLSKGGAVEQGKDIIAIDPKGEVHCYQLKYGNFNTPQWRQHKAELDELVELPPRHPSLPNEVKYWHSYLVTNGTLGNSVARNIDDWAKVVKDRGSTEFKTILIDDLVADFSKHYGSFFPDTPNDLHAFLSIYNEYGDNTLDNKQFKQFFEAYFENVAASTKSKARRREAINASVILCSYLLTNKSVEENHLEMIKAWTLLLITILHYAEKFGIKADQIADTESLILDSLDIEYRQLIDDICTNTTHMVDGKYNPLCEAFVTYKLRCTELTGFVSAYMTMCAMRGVEPYAPENLFEKLMEMSKHKILFGESSVPLFINFIVYMNGIGVADRRDYELSALLSSFLSTHGRDQPGLPSPHYSLVESVEMALGLADDSQKETFEARAYTLWPLIMLAAKFDMREIVEPHWRRISFIACQDFRAKDSNDLLLWTAKEGTLHDTFPEPEESWKKLREEAQQDYTADLPQSLRDRKYLLPVMINVMPHRTTKSTVLNLL